MGRASRFAAVATAAFVLAVAGQRAEAAEPCAQAGLQVMPSPFSPWKGAPLRVMVVSRKAARWHDLADRPRRQRRRQIVRPAWRSALFLVRRGRRARRRQVARLAGARPPGGGLQRDHPRDHRQRDQAGAGRDTLREIWQVTGSWNHANESAVLGMDRKTVRRAARPGSELEGLERSAARPVAQFPRSTISAATKTKARRGLRPDCADFVYFLRAYFAYKMGLPFGYSNCSRGGGGRPPKCYQWFDIEHPEVTRPPPPPEQDAAAGCATAAPPPRQRRRLRFLRPVAAGRAPADRPARRPARSSGQAEARRRISANICVTSATSSIPARCASSASDDNTDFYTVPLTQKALRPGTVYADPYGHVLMLVHRVPEVDGKPGVFLAVDAEPDGSITRKRFWRGNFLFVHDPALGSPGFKHFRPDRARQERPAAAADQRRDRQESAIRRFLARAVADERWRISTIAWTT